MTRKALPHRRRSEAFDVVFEEATYRIGVGFDAAGRPMECFVDGPPIGSAMHRLLQDLCVVLSIPLQHGITPAQLAASLAMVPALTDGNLLERHASIVGEIVAGLQPQVDMIRARVEAT